VYSPAMAWFPPCLDVSSTSFFRGNQQCFSLTCSFDKGGFPLRSSTLLIHVHAQSIEKYVHVLLFIFLQEVNFFSLNHCKL
jgi:hypothetical protein